MTARTADSIPPGRLNDIAPFGLGASVAAADVSVAVEEEVAVVVVASVVDAPLVSLAEEVSVPVEEV